MEEGRGGARGEVMAGRGVLGGFYEGIWKGRGKCPAWRSFWGLQYFYKNAALSWNPNISFFLDQMLITMSMKLGQWADSGTGGQKQGAALQCQVSTSLTLCGRERGVTWSKEIAGGLETHLLHSQLWTLDRALKRTAYDTLCQVCPFKF